jgi:DNA-binding transcriptional MerR regulator/quercetin dioxygenase-like cupin family protein
MAVLPMRQSEARYSIGEVARITELSISAMRLLEREGLVRPARTPGGHRVYSDADVERLRHIRLLRRVDRLNAAAIRRELGAADTTAATDAPAADPALGRRLRALRIACGMLLADVRARTGLSVSFLSAAERGLSGISVGSLVKLADAYETTVPGLLSSRRQETGRMLVPDQRPRFTANAGRVLIEDLMTRTGDLEVQRFEILPGGESEEAYSHPGEEFVFVLSGQLSFWIGEHEFYELTPGASLHLPSKLPHRWRNRGSEPAVILWVNAHCGDEMQSLTPRLAARSRRNSN